MEKGESPSGLPSLGSEKAVGGGKKAERGVFGGPALQGEKTCFPAGDQSSAARTADESLEKERENLLRRPLGGKTPSRSEIHRGRPCLQKKKIHLQVGQLIRGREVLAIGMKLQMILPNGKRPPR